MRSTPLAGERLRPLGHLSGKGEIAGTLCHFKRIARQLVKFPTNYRTLYIRNQKYAWNRPLSLGVGSLISSSTTKKDSHPNQLMWQYATVL